MIKYNILATGSEANCTIIEDNIAIDMGVTYKKLRNYCKTLKLVLLTHQHSDHFNKTTIRTLAKNRPTLRWGCCEWLVDELLQCGVAKKNIDVYSIGKKYNYGVFQIVPILLYHDVSNCGYRIFYKDEKILYATDTNTLSGIKAKGYSLYLVEANYSDEELKERIKEKEQKGQFVYEYRVANSHLSLEQCNDFLLANIGDNSTAIYMHGHKEKELQENESFE